MAASTGSLQPLIFYQEHDMTENRKRKVRGIMFADEMVQAIGRGWKTHTRRLMPARVLAGLEAGDLLYVREAHARMPDGSVMYRAGYPLVENIRWTPGMLMPRHLSRYTLRVKAIGRQRVQDITVSDCLREGTPRRS